MSEQAEESGRGPAGNTGEAERPRTHDPQVGATLREFMAQGWAARDRAPSADPAAVARTAERRARLSASFPGERLIIPSGPAKVRNNDVDHRFRPDSDHVWLSGSRFPGAVLVLEPVGTSGHDALLFFRPQADRESSMEFWRDGAFGEFWVGRRPDLDEAAAEYGLVTRHIEQLTDHLKGGVPTRVRRGVDPAVDALVPDRDDDGSIDRELVARLSELRLVKDAWEIAQLRAAVDTTVRGFEDCVRELPHAIALRDGPGERWLEGTFWRRARLEGNDVGYHSIVAAGPHATTLHWIDDDGPVRPGDLLLMDMGAETRDLYTADVTRTLPVSGSWSSLQRELYSLELAAADAAIAAVAPGRPFRDYHQAAMAVIAHGLADMGLLPCSAEEALDKDSQLYRRWTLHGSGHMLGLDVHDCGAAPKQAYVEGVLAEGQVLTVEPGLYFQESDLLVPPELRGSGFRIEDDLLVTSDGAELLSAALPREPDAIEEWMGTLTS